MAAKAGAAKTPFIKPQKTKAQAAPNALPKYTTAQMHAYNAAVRRVFFRAIGQINPKVAPYPPGSAPQPARIQGSAGAQLRGGKMNAQQFAGAARARARAAAVRARAIAATAAQAKQGGLSRNMQSAASSAAFYARAQASSAAAQAAGANAAAAVPVPKTAVGTRKSEGPWITAGNDEKYDCCIAVAVANHLWLTTEIRLTDEQVWMLHAAGGGKDIENTLKAAASGELWHNVVLEDYLKLEEGEPVEGALLIAFPAENGDHVALLLPDGRMASWGESYDTPEYIEEAWALKWQTKTTS